MDGKLQSEYEDRLQKALQELRDVYDNKMQQSSEDFAKLYDERVRDLQNQLAKERGQNTGAHHELKEARSRIESLISKVADLENANLALNQKIAEMSQDMEDLKSSHRAQVAAKDEEIKRLLDELANQVHKLGYGTQPLRGCVSAYVSTLRWKKVAIRPMSFTQPI